MNLKPNQSVNVVALGEAGCGLGLMLVYAANKVICDTQIERPVSAAGEKINVERQASPHASFRGAGEAREPGTHEHRWSRSCTVRVHGFRARRFAPSRHDQSLPPL